MGDSPIEQATKDGLAVQGMWKKGQVGPMDMGRAQDALGLSMVPSARGLAEAALPFALSTAGALGGAAIGGPVAPGLAIGGAGAGAAAGEALNPALFRMFGAEPPASMTGNRALDVGLMGAFGAGGQAAGELGAATVSRLLRNFTPAPAAGAPALRQRFTDVGVDLKAADVSPNLAALERSVAQTPTGGQIIREAGDRQARQLLRAKDEFLDRLAPAAAGERVATGEKASAAIKRQLERTGALEDALWTQMGQMAHDLPVANRNLKTFAETALLNEKRGRDPNASVVTFLEKIIADSDEWAWQVADATRKQYGRGMSGAGAIADVPQSVYKGAYAALMNDMEATAAASQVPGLTGSYRAVRDFTEHRLSLFRDSQVARVLDADPEKVVQTLNAAGGPSAIRRAREAILGNTDLWNTASPGDIEAWNYVRRHVLEGVFNKAVNEEYKGLSAPVIVGSRLDKAIKIIGDDGLRELLTPMELRALENIQAVAKAMRASERIGALPGTSTTPQGMGFMDLFRSPGVLAGGALGGLFGGAAGAATGAAAGGFASFVLVPHILAKALTNPRAAAIIASPGFAGLAHISRGGAAAAREGALALSRLAGILAAESQGAE